MELKEILAVSGKGGLFKIITQTKAGLIVESLLDHKRMPVYASDKISNLEEISVYTDDKEVPLKEIFKSIFDKESGGKALDAKIDEKKLKEYFALILPNYDRDKVYVSDMKKIMNWYNILHDNKMIEFKEEESKEEKPAEDEKTTEEKSNPPVAEGKE
jgi:hypothetical protein